jgi:hypothetical protein
VIHLRAAPLREAARWLEHYRGFWDARLEALEQYLLERRRSAPSARARRAGAHRP